MLAAPCLGCSTLPSAEPRCHTYLRWMQRFETNLGSAVSWEECSVAAVTELGGVLCCSGHDGVRIRTHSVVCLILGTRTKPFLRLRREGGGPGSYSAGEHGGNTPFLFVAEVLVVHSATCSFRTFRNFFKPNLQASTARPRLKGALAGCFAVFSRCFRGVFEVFSRCTDSTRALYGLYTPFVCVALPHLHLVPLSSSWYAFYTHSKNGPLVAALSNGKVYPPREGRYVIA